VRHSLTIEGPAFRLRPVRIEDAEFIVQLRSDPERCRYLHRTPAGTSAQEKWLNTYFERRGDYYFLVENRATRLPEGTAGIYNAGWSIDGSTDRLQRDAEWGRWVLRRGSLAALESACLVYRVGFEMLDLDSVYCRTIIENASALAFHDSFGLERGRVLPGYLERDGRRLDAMECRLTRARWMALRDSLERKALRAAAWSQRPRHASQAAAQPFGGRQLGIKAS
jgi:RimJ/RimL family protein N-acetyltransferase